MRKIIVILLSMLALVACTPAQIAAVQSHNRQEQVLNYTIRYQCKNMEGFSYTASRVAYQSMSPSDRALCKAFVFKGDK